MKPCHVHIQYKEFFNGIDYKNLFLIYYFFQIFSINIMGMYDKQFGRNSASLFICRVCLSANVALLYVLFHFVAKAKEKTFFAN